MRRISAVPTGGAIERYKYDSYTVMSSSDIHQHKMNISFKRYFEAQIYEYYNEKIDIYNYIYKSARLQMF